MLLVSSISLHRYRQVIALGTSFSTWRNMTDLASSLFKFPSRLCGSTTSLLGAFVFARASRPLLLAVRAFPAASHSHDAEPSFVASLATRITGLTCVTGITP